MKPMDSVLTIKCPKCGDIIFSLSESHVATCKCGDTYVKLNEETGEQEFSSEHMDKLVGKEGGLNIKYFGRAYIRY